MMNSAEKESIYDFAIVGSGAAGLSAAIYAGRYQMRTLLVEGEFGGETAKAGKIENYPGAPSIDGYDLMKLMKQQALEVGTHYVEGWVTDIKGEEGCFTLTVGAHDTYYAKTILLGGGAERRRLEMPRIRKSRLRIRQGKP